MFGLTGRHVLPLQGAGGEPFTAFMNDLLRAHGRAHGLLDADIDTSIRANIPDGGVDASVRRSLPNDPTGWLAVPSVWQYKGTDNANVTVDRLLEGAAVVERIEAGDAFRLALADDLPDPKRRDWEQRLTALARVIKRDAPEARVVTADDMAVWASRYPGLVLRFLRPNTVQNVLHFEAWQQNVVHATRRYVPVAEWEGVTRGLRDHVNLDLTVIRAVAPLFGDAGVGKTRLAYEVAAGISGAAALVVYTENGETAVRVATELANEAEARAILIADECGPEDRLRLERVLAGHTRRVRAVAIDNSGQRAAGADPALLLHKMPLATLRSILDLNYPGVREDRRRTYGTLADGFPRLAADLCDHDGLLVAGGGLGPVVGTVHDYLRVRLDQGQFEALAALALVTKIGYNGAVANELDALCQWLSVQRGVVEQALHQIHDGPGFVARTGRFLYVTPELVAQVACADAWRRWGLDPTRLLASVPELFAQSFLNRIWQSAPEEVRRACAEYFREWAASLTPEKLADVDIVGRLVALADTKPEECFPLVRRLVEAAPLEILKGVSGEGMIDGRWGPRRALVWLAERFAQFPAHFDDAERMLLRMAVAESEPRISNNASAIWRQLYRVQLSGSATPFAERLARLRNRLFDGDPLVRTLASAALAEVFDHHVSRTIGPALVAGRIPPEEWRPKSRGEERDALSAALVLLGDANAHGGDLRSAAVATVTRHLRSLVARGLLPQAHGILSANQLTDAELAALVEEIDTTLAYDYPSDRGPQPAKAGGSVGEQLVAWRRALASGDFHHRLVATVGKGQWDGSRVHALVRARASGEPPSTDPFLVELEALAEELLNDPDRARSELRWLTGDLARSAEEFGEALGRRDRDAVLLQGIGDAIRTGGLAALARGYVRGLVASGEGHVARVNEWLDGLESVVPTKAAEIAMAGGASVQPMRRVLRLFDEGRVPAAYLFDRHFVQGMGRDLTSDELLPLLERLALSAPTDPTAERVGIDSLSLRLPYEPPIEPLSFLVEEPALRAVAWRLLDARPAGSPPVSHWWRSLVVALGRIEPGRAARLAGALLGGDDYGAREEGQAALKALAASNPHEVMEAVGVAALDKKTGWRFFLGKLGDLLAALPIEVVQSWLEQVGVEGARRLARHLPQPYVDSTDKPVVPTLTEWVLRTFESDDRTFREFCAGRHNLQVYSGDIAAQHEAEAATARRFLDYPLRRIREWAVVEVQSATAEAAEARRWEEEIDLP